MKTADHDPAITDQERDLRRFLLCAAEAMRSGTHEWDRETGPMYALVELSHALMARLARAECRSVSDLHDELSMSIIWDELEL